MTTQRGQTEGRVFRGTALEIFRLSGGYFLIEHSTGTSTKPIFSSISLCHKDQNQPLHIFSHDDSVSFCLTYIDNDPILVYATKDMLYFYPLYLEEYQSPTKSPQSYSYKGICKVLTLPNHNIAVAGTKLDAKGKWVLEEIDVQKKSVVHSWICAASKSSTPQNLFCSSDSWCFHVGAQLIRCPFDGTSAKTEKIPEGAPKEVFEIYNNEREKVGMASWKGSKAKTYSARLDQVPAIGLQPPKKPTPKLVAVFEYQNDLLMVAFNGVISLLGKGESLDLSDVLNGNATYSTLLSADSLEIRGALLYQNELVLYGKNSIFFSIQLEGDDTSSWTVKEWPQLHYGKGGVSNVYFIGEELNGFSAPLLLSQSDDNDIRLWDFSKRTCVGLFRAHANKLKLCSVFDDTLISIDVERNLRVWEIQQSAQKQYETAPQKQSPFINRVVGTKNNIFVLNQNFETSIWPNQGEEWTQQSSQDEQNKQQNKVFGSLKRSIPLSKSVVCNISNRLHIFHTERNEHISLSTVLSPQSNKEKKWEITKIARAGGEQVLVSGTSKDTDKSVKETQYFVALVDSEGNICRYLELERLAITLKYMDEKSILVCQEEGTQKILRQIYWETSSKKSGLSFSFEHSASIAGIYLSPSQKRILVWDSVAGRETSFFCVHEDELYGPFSNPNCRLPPSSIIETTQGLVFTERDAHRWSLSMAVREDGLWPVLNGLSSEMFALEHFSDLYEQLSSLSPQMCSSMYQVFAESESYGVNVYYQAEEEIRHATWMGTMMRNYTIGGVFDEGRIVAYKNREVIVLQLMRGSTEISFAELFSK
ncbi:MAG: hypothetical protein CL916_06735 [Deltaproteobacteria bacterium]|nr:hypothetical protein [Deltaproteobacteria bacterium]